MTRRVTALLAAALLFASCGGDAGSDATDSAATTPPTTPTTVPAPEPTTEPAVSPTTMPSPTTSIEVASPTTTPSPATSIEVAGISRLAPGLFCRDLFAAGYDYEAAVTYWVREGSPDRMDADRNGIPCETVYPEEDILAFWGDPLPTTTTMPEPEWTLAGLEAAIEADWPEDWGWEKPDGLSCEPSNGEPIGPGSVLSCAPEVTSDGQHPVLTVLLLDSDTYTMALAGIDNTILDPAVLQATFGQGSFCRDLLADDSPVMTQLDTAGKQYFASVTYWFMEGRPDRMDADTNGTPCETLFAPDVVEELWNGGAYGH